MSDAPIIGRVVSVHVGRVAPLGPEAEPSGFVKHAVAGPVAVGRLGLAGLACALALLLLDRSAVLAHHIGSA